MRTITILMAALTLSACEKECQPYHSLEDDECVAWSEKFIRTWQVDSCHCSVPGLTIEGQLMNMTTSGNANSYMFDNSVLCMLIDDRLFESGTQNGQTAQGQPFTVRIAGSLRENLTQGTWIGGTYVGAQSFNTLHSTLYYNEGQAGAFTCSLVLK